MPHLAPVFYSGHADAVSCVTFSSDGQCALSGSKDKTVRLWDLNTGACLRVLEGHTASVLGVALSAHGSRALSGSEDKTVRLWDLATGACLHVLEGHADSVLSLAFSPDGNRALSGSKDKTVRSWDLDTGVCSRVLELRADSVSAIAFSPDGRCAFSGSRSQVGGSDNTVHAWDLETGQCLHVIDRDLWGTIVGIDLSADGRYALSGFGCYSATSDAGDCIPAYQKLRLWEVATGKCQQVVCCSSIGLHSVALSGDGRYALSGHGSPTDPLYHFWQLPTGERAITMNMVLLTDINDGTLLRVFKGHARPVESVAFSHDGRFALSGSSDKTIRVWDLLSGRCLQVLAGKSTV